MVSAASTLFNLYEPPNEKPEFASTRCRKSAIPELIKVQNSILSYPVAYSDRAVYRQNLQILLKISSNQRWDYNAN